MTEPLSGDGLAPDPGGGRPWFALRRQRTPGQRWAAGVLPPGAMSARRTRTYVPCTWQGWTAVAVFLGYLVWRLCVLRATFPLLAPGSSPDDFGRLGRLTAGIFFETIPPVAALLLLIWRKGEKPSDDPGRPEDGRAARREDGEG